MLTISSENCKRSSQLFFTSIDDIVLLADQEQKILLCNYSKSIHQKIFADLQNFIRFSNIANGFNINISYCFHEAPTSFAIDQQTMLNLRIAIEVIDSYQVKLSRDGADAVKGIKRSFTKDKHPSLMRLEKHLSKQNILSLLKFFNSDCNVLVEEMATNLIEQVIWNHSAYHDQLQRTDGIDQEIHSVFRVCCRESGSAAWND